jgi:hypothetical protein
MQRIGKIEYASGGTLFLDEVESMPMAMQVKLLRVLQFRQVERLGSNKPVPVALRVVAVPGMFAVPPWSMAIRSLTETDVAGGGSEGEQTTLRAGQQSDRN